MAIGDGNIVTVEEGKKMMDKKNLSWIDNEGRAEKNHIGYKKNACEHCAAICHRINIEDGCIMCMTQISANGNISFGGQLSFEHIDKFSIGNILEKPISCMIKDWQWKEPLLCDEVDKMLKIQSLIDYNHEVPEFTIFQTKNDNDNKKYMQMVADLMCFKRELLKVGHEQLQYLNYEELVEAIDADINIRTDGLFVQYMRFWYDNYEEKYSDNWKYNQAHEQAICNKYKILNFKRMFGLSLEPTLPYTLNSCDAKKVYEDK